MSLADEPSSVEHLRWCIRRALEYVETGHLHLAYASMVSDLLKHPQTATHPGIKLGQLMMMNGQLNTTEAMRRFIVGFGGSKRSEP